MFLEIDEVIIDKEVWGKVLLGDKKEIVTLRNKLHDLHLYMHGASSYFMDCVIEDPNKYVVVTLRELHERSLIGMVRIDNECWNFVEELIPLTRTFGNVT